MKHKRLTLAGLLAALVLASLLPGQVSAAEIARKATADLPANIHTTCPSGGASGFVPGPSPSFAAQVESATLGGGVKDLAVFDINGDGHLDVVAFGNMSYGFKYLLGAGDGTLGTPQNINAGFDAFFTPRAGAIADMNQDGKPDVVLVHDCTGGSDESVYVALNSTGTTFQTASKYPLTANMCPKGVVVADFNRDGWPDVATGNFGTGGTGNANSRWTSVFLNDGDGTLGAEARYYWGCYWHPQFDCAAQGMQAQGMAAGDWNHDGVIDLASAEVRQGSDATQRTA